jgi:DNA-binding protein YbaB
MSRFDQAKMLMKVKKIQSELQKQLITVEKGDGAVKVEINGEQKIKKYTSTQMMLILMILVSLNAG